MGADAEAERFLAVSGEFRLGELATERSHPATAELSRLAEEDPCRGITALAGIDLEALARSAEKVPEIVELRSEIGRTLRDGKRVFLCGCGATGRLSLSLEVLWREHIKDPRLRDSVIGFMAGGDAALIRAIEDFEDHPEFAARQMRELCFGPEDLLIACTEGGETPFVIGAAEAALKTSSRAPFFLYCNPDGPLCKAAERSKRVLEEPGIRKLNLETGPMALAGSTRMQASTVLMLAVGAALFGFRGDFEIPREIERLAARLHGLDANVLAPFIEEESRIYDAEGYILYETDVYGITLLTDTTERAPTFSLLPFESRRVRPSEPSLCYLCLPEEEEPRGAWRRLLGRAPRPLDWKRYPRTGLWQLQGFDLSRRTRERRERKVGAKNQHRFAIERSGDRLSWRLGRLQERFDVSGLPLLSEHLLLKMLLNIHSTLVMGRLGRYEGNLMTWVRPSCNKLIDRAIRYTIELARRDRLSPSYEEAALALFHEKRALRDDEPIVLRTLDRLKKGVRV